MPSEKNAPAASQNRKNQAQSVTNRDKRSAVSQGSQASASENERDEAKTPLLPSTMTCISGMFDDLSGLKDPAPLSIRQSIVSGILIASSVFVLLVLVLHHICPIFAANGL